MRIGILAFQGDIEKHLIITEKSGADALLVKNEKQLDCIQGLIIPGGESTTIGKLLDRFSLLKPLQKKILGGLPVFGTCAGAILLAKEIISSSQFRIGTMHISISRNAYGPQIESFETDIVTSLPGYENETMRAIFIRAPIITGMGKECKVYASFEGKPVLVREKNMLAATFHPELTGDMRIHTYFISMIEGIV